MSRLNDLLSADRAGSAALLRRAGWFAALVASASVLLLGLSGWFIAAAATAGAAGTAVALSFNYMLPSAAIRLLAIVRTGARYGERLASHDAAFTALARLRPRLFRAIAGAPARHALSYRRGETTARFIQDVDAIEARFVRRSAPWSVVAAALAGAATIWLGSWWAVATTGLCFSALFLMAGRMMKRADQLGRQIQQLHGSLKDEAAALLDVAADLRCYGRADWAADRLAALGDELAAAQQARAGIEGRIEALRATAIGLASVCALLLSRQAGAPLAALAALAAAMTIDGTAPLLKSMAQRGALHEAEDRIEELLAMEQPPLPAVDSAPFPSLTLTVDRPFHLIAGARLLLSGRSGSGKTSLVERLIGLRPIEPGRLWIDGTDAASLPAETLRACFAWLPQDASLLSGTVRDNLRLAAPDADEAAMWQALHDAALDEKVRSLPSRLDCWIGEDGARLSGGERRRLALARASLSPARWLLLDEPTEALDSATEVMVRDRLSARLARTGQGLILVSHRPAMTALVQGNIAQVDTQPAQDHPAVPAMPAAAGPHPGAYAVHRLSIAG